MRAALRRSRPGQAARAAAFQYISNIVLEYQSGLKGDLQHEPRESEGGGGGCQHRGEQRGRGAPRAARGRRRKLCGCSQERQIFDFQKVVKEWVGKRGEGGRGRRVGKERKPGEVGGDGAELKKFNVKKETGCWMENR